MHVMIVVIADYIVVPLIRYYFDIILIFHPNTVTDKILAHWSR